MKIFERIYDNESYYVCSLCEYALCARRECDFVGLVLSYPKFVITS